MRTKTRYLPGTRYQSTVSPTGQITIPAAVLRHLGWVPTKTRLLLERRGDRVALRALGRSIAAQTAGSPKRFVPRDTRKGVADR
jgi:bifunctional DNA-binding transcriptional regulator/antitoxin component of YhaV-PrlF toxin-antitoxin module